MARQRPAAVQLESRHNPGDGSTTYRVRWPELDPAAVAAGAPARPTVAFNSRKCGGAPAAHGYAQRLRSLVEANGGATPTRDQLVACGLGWKYAADHQPSSAPVQPPVPASMPYVTVADACRQWIAWKQESMRPLSTGSVKKYRRNIRCYIDPLPIGAANIATVVTGEQIGGLAPDPDTCMGWQLTLWKTVLIGSRTGKRLSVKQIENVRTMLSSVFDWACTTNSGKPPLRTAQNPLRGMATPPAAALQLPDILHDPQEVAMFLRLAQRVDPEWAEMLLIVLATGLRECEISMLEPCAVDASRNILRVTRHWGDGGQIEFGRKNGDPGEIPIPIWIMRRILLPRAQAGGPLLFMTPRGCRWTSHRHCARFKKLRALLMQAGMPREITLHKLRHSYSNWIKDDLNLEVHAAAMGHRRKTQTGTYVQLTARDMIKIRNLVTAFVPETEPATPEEPQLLPQLRAA
jgi:integrase